MLQISKATGDKNEGAVWFRWIAEGQDIGSTSISYTPYFARISNVRISSDFQNLGHGKAMILAIIEWIKTNIRWPSDGLHLCVLSENHRAIHVYESCGFYVSSTVDLISFMRLKERHNGVSQAGKLHASEA